MLGDHHATVRGSTAGDLSHAGSLLTRCVSPAAVTKEDVENHFKEGPGKIGEIKLMSGFGFIEYEDKADARDVVPGESPHPLSTCTDRAPPPWRTG